MAYTVTELANKFGTTRKTVYNKLNNPSIHKYTRNTDSGLVLEDEGFNVFLDMMSKSKVNSVVNTKETVESDKYIDLYISSLLEQICILRVENEDLKKQLEKANSKNDILFQEFMNLNQKLLPGERKKFWWFMK